MVLRLWHGAIAVLVLAALALQVGIAVRVPGHPANVEPGILRGASLPGRVIRVFSFFTVEANILSAITSAQLSRRPDREGSVWRVLRLNALVGIAVTGVVYSTVLARVHQPHGWAEVSTNTIFHYIVPIMMVVGWLVLGPRPRINAGIVGWSLVFPALWFAYTLGRGALWHWYPYPFLQVPTHGYPTVLVNAVLVTLVLTAVSALFAAGDRKLPPAPGPSILAHGPIADRRR